MPQWRIHHIFYSRICRIFNRINYLVGHVVQTLHVESTWILPKLIRSGQHRLVGLCYRGADVWALPNLRLLVQQLGFWRGIHQFQDDRVLQKPRSTDLLDRWYLTFMHSDGDQFAVHCRRVVFAEPSMDSGLREGDDWLETDETIQEVYRRVTVHSGLAH